MPEGDVVRRTARTLHAALAGQVLTSFDLRVPQWATTDLCGNRVEAVLAVGKHLLMRVAPELTVHSHLRMDGSWQLYRPGQRWTGGAGHTIRAVLGNEQWQAVGYRVHELAVVARADEGTLVGHLGPDLLGTQWQVQAGVTRLLADPGRTVGEALVDQRTVAGIGNVYKSETLFLAGVDPWLPVGSVPDPAAVLGLARRLMTANLARTGQVTTGQTRRGHQHWVYRRDGQPCRRCGTTVRAGVQGAPGSERSTYWCPACQPGPGPGAASTGGSSTTWGGRGPGSKPGGASRRA